MQNITIIGAGLVGSLHSLFLSKNGCSVDVYEKRSDPRAHDFMGGRSINLALSDRGWKALQKVEMDQRIRKIVIPMKGRVMHDTSGALTYQAYGSGAQAIYSVPRADLNIALLEEADKNKDVHLHFNEKLIDLNFKTQALTFEHYQTKKQTKKNYSVLFGTDGAFSKVRLAMQKTPGFNFSQQYISHGYKEFEIPASHSGGYLLENHNALHIWPRGNYMLIALPNHDKTFTCTLFYPLKGADSFESLSTFESFERFFKAAFPDAYTLIGDLEHDFKNNPTSHLVYTMANPWHYKDNVCLLGDAAHAIVPFYGQGMNSGFEDCTLFNALLLANKKDIQKTISQFSDQRIEDAKAISELALYNFIEMRDRVADPSFLLQKKIESFLAQKHPRLWTPLYSMVTFSHTPYSEALKRGKTQEKIMQEILTWKDIEQFSSHEALQKKALDLIKSLL